METRGLEPVPDSERTGRVRALFPTRVGANPTVLSLTIGAGLVVFGGPNLGQALTVALATPAIGFGPVGPISLAGRSGGAPGMALSRAAFGPRGNPLPGAPIRIARRAWEKVNAVTGTYTVLRLLFGIASDDEPVLVTLVCFARSSFPVSGVGVRTLRVCCTWATCPRRASWTRSPPSCPRSR
ncbi:MULTISPECIES: cytosine permease [unclassified Streptomyces]|uniref:cytosine permease n=1 Tax=unclassified Streptomyces TaxID=2593676 RepID=UPI00093DACBC